LGGQEKKEKVTHLLEEEIKLSCALKEFHPKPEKTWKRAKPPDLRITGGYFEGSFGCFKERDANGTGTE